MPPGATKWASSSVARDPMTSGASELLVGNFSNLAQFPVRFFVTPLLWSAPNRNNPVVDLNSCQIHTYVQGLCFIIDRVYQRSDWECRRSAIMGHF